MIVIEKGGNIKEVTIPRENVSDVSFLCKKAGFKSDAGFEKRVDWVLKKMKWIVQLYGKTSGRANMENKYDFPPPVDNTLFFGSCVLIAHSTEENKIVDFSKKSWEKVYEKLFGGFYDLKNDAEEDEKEIDELALVPKNKKTKKGGYLKDGFVVDSDECDEEGYDDDDDDDDEVEDDDDDGEGEEEDEGEEDIDVDGDVDGDGDGDVDGENEVLKGVEEEVLDEDVDVDEDEDGDGDVDVDEDEDGDEDGDGSKKKRKCKNKNKKKRIQKKEKDVKEKKSDVLFDIGTELSEEEYDYN